MTLMSATISRRRRENIEQITTVPASSFVDVFVKVSRPNLDLIVKKRTYPRFATANYVLRVLHELPVDEVCIVDCRTASGAQKLADLIATSHSRSASTIAAASFVARYHGKMPLTNRKASCLDDQWKDGDRGVMDAGLLLRQTPPRWA